MKEEQKTEKILLRVTPSSKKWIKDQAVKDDRSVNSVINKVIEKAKQEDK